MVRAVDKADADAFQHSIIGYREPFTSLPFVGPKPSDFLVVLQFFAYFFVTNFSSNRHVMFKLHET